MVNWVKKLLTKIVLMNNFLGSFWFFFLYKKRIFKTKLQYKIISKI